ncbi:capsid cement protein [Natrialba taiwanensis]|uniref:Uncharacterized protein n=1 Tax=Natrialba taiwanensis DSM 12281 TaxID=1230458 RepID=M0A2A2_9EURY|nr:capsid cement protein [Natrialba taiwanensis]ELY91468.1 hypothetical protein C484_10586 [Natrialba taiwanensis DSM 12281]
MAKPAGHAVYDGRTVSFPTDGSVASGEIVALDGSGQASSMAGDGSSNAIGIVSDKANPDAEAGDNIPVHVTGVVIGEVPSGTAAGETVANGKYDTFSDEGGQFKQHDTSSVSLDAGYAAVHLG